MSFNSVTVFNSVIQSKCSRFFTKSFFWSRPSSLVAQASGFFHRKQSKLDTVRAVCCGVMQEFCTRVTCEAEKMVGKDGMAILFHLCQFSAECKQVCTEVLGNCQLAKGEDATGCEKAAQAILDLLKRMEDVFYDKVIASIAKKEFGAKELKACMASVPVPLQGAMQVLELDWNSELSKLKDEPGNGKIPWILSMLNTFETANAGATSRVLEDEVFSDCRQNCKEYSSKFVMMLSQILEHEARMSMLLVSAFSDKFKEMEECAETLDTKPVSWMFDDEHEQEIAGDIMRLEGGMKKANSFIKGLQPLVNHVTASSMLPAVITTASSKQAEVRDKASTAARLATLLAFVDLTVDGDKTKKEVDELEKYTQKVFGFDRTVLPSRASDAIAEISKRLPKASRKPDQAGKEKKDKKPERKVKEKTEKGKAEKGEKASSSRPTKHRADEAEGGSKAKKARKLKS